MTVRNRVTDTRGLTDWSTDDPADQEVPQWNETAGEYQPGTVMVPASSVRGAGRWEVVVDGTPPVAVTNEAEDDWVYGWVSD